MKCVLSVLLLAYCGVQLISAIPLKNGMVFYQSHPYDYNGHRAFVMQYASQPSYKAYRRNGVAPVASSGVSAFVAGKKITTGTILKQSSAESLEEEEELPQLDGGAHSVAEAYPSEVSEEEEIEDEQPTVANDIPEEETPLADEEEEVAPPTALVPSKKKSPPRRKPVEEDEDEEEEEVPVRATRNRSQGAPIYFPVHFGSTNGGAIAVANSYSTGKGGSASSRATAYGSPSKARKTLKKTANSN